MHPLTKRLRLPVHVFVLYFSISVFTQYTFGYSLPIVAALLALALLIVCHKRSLKNDKGSQNKIKWRGRKSLMIVALALLAFSLVLGHHIHIGENTYSGTIAENYIEPYSWFDAVAYICILYVLMQISRAIAQIASDYRAKYASGTAVKVSSIPLKPFLIASAAIAALWLPYLLAYWPGLIFSDTLTSLDQVFGSQLSNHHPVAFTLTMKLCIQAASIIGLSHTSGIALFTIFQMTFMAICLGYLAVWFIERLGFRKQYVWLIVAIFGISPYIATYSIALWKDPVFSCSICIICVILADAVLAREVALSQFQKIALCLLSLSAMLFRNNGVYIVLALVLLLVAVSIVSLVRKQSFGYTSILLPLFISFAAYLVISGPVYSALHVIPTEKVESLGIPLNQMARVAALNGDMSDSDRAYMDSLLPLGQYKDKYSPTCTDKLKWDSEFNSEPLSSNFWSHWISMMLRNPKVYFEAWEMQTCGYWTVNVPAAVQSASNIYGGVPRNIYPENNIGHDITSKNLLKFDSIRNALPLTSYSISGGLVFWVLIIACTILILNKRWQWILPILPLLLLYGTLFIASPIWYWPRYIFTAQLALPVVIVLLYRALIANEAHKPRMTQ